MYQNIKLRHYYVTVVHKYFCCRKMFNKLKSQIYDNARLFISHSISTALSNIGKKVLFEENYVQYTCQISCNIYDIILHIIGFQN